MSFIYKNEEKEFEKFKRAVEKACKAFEALRKADEEVKRLLARHQETTRKVMLKSMPNQYMPPEYLNDIYSSVSEDMARKRTPPPPRLRWITKTRNKPLSATILGGEDGD